MASGYKTEMLDMYTCQVCLEYMLDSNPRLLSCHHTFCERCLKQMTRNLKIKCPSCRVETPVPQGDVNKLTKDFRLLQIKEHMERIATIPVRYCQVCMKSVDMTDICETCDKPTCQCCKKLKGIVDLSMQKLCTKHPENRILQICIECLDAVCKKCILLDHSEHEDKILPYGEGIGILSFYINDLVSRIQQIITCKNEEILKEKVNRIKITQATHQVKLEKRSFEKKTEEINSKMKNKEQKEISERNIEEYSKMFDKLTDLLEKVTRGNIEDARKIIKTVEEEIKLFGDAEAIGIHQSLSVVCFSKTHNWLENPQLMVDVQKSGNFEMLEPVGVACVDGFVFIADSQLCHITKMTNEGETIEEIETKPEYGEVVNVRTFLDVVYIGQAKCITKCSLSDLTDTEEYLPDLDSLCAFDVLNAEVLILALVHGWVYEYNTVKKSKKKVLTKDEGCFETYVSCGTCEDGTRFILSFGVLGKIEIYNKDWESIKYVCSYEHGYLDTSFSTCVTPGGFLVADFELKKIVHFTIDGKFIQHIMTDKDGLGHPYRISYQTPFLWVIQYETANFETPKIRRYLISTC